MTNTDRDGLVRLLRHARDAAGSTSELADVVEARLGYRPDPKVITAWIRGEREPKEMAIIFAIVAGLHDRGVSFDQVALVDSDQRPLQVQVEELRSLVIQLHEAINLDRANRELPPVEIRFGERTG